MDWIELDWWIELDLIGVIGLVGLAGLDWIGRVGGIGVVGLAGLNRWDWALTPWAASLSTPQGKKGTGHGKHVCAALGRFGPGAGRSRATSYCSGSLGSAWRVWRVSVLGRSGASIQLSLTRRESRDVIDE